MYEIKYYHNGDLDVRAVRVSAADDYDLFVKMYKHRLGEIQRNTGWNFKHGKLYDQNHDVYKTVEDLVKFLDYYNASDSADLILEIKRPDGTLLYSNGPADEPAGDAWVYWDGAKPEGMEEPVTDETLE